MKSAAIYESFLQQNFSLLLHKLVILARGILIFCHRISAFGRGIGQKNSTEFYFFSRGIPECLSDGKLKLRREGMSNKQ